MIRVLDNKTDKIYYIEKMEYYSDELGECILDNNELSDEEKTRNLSDIEFIKNSYIKTSENEEIFEKDIILIEKENDISLYAYVSFEENQWFANIRKIIENDVEREVSERIPLHTITNKETHIVGDLKSSPDLLLAHGISANEISVNTAFGNLKDDIIYKTEFLENRENILGYRIFLDENIYTDVFAQTPEEFETSKDLEEYLLKTYNYKLRNIDYNQLFDKFYVQGETDVFELVERLNRIKENIEQ